MRLIVDQVDAGSNPVIPAMRIVKLKSHEFVMAVEFCENSFELYCEIGTCKMCGTRLAFNDNCEVFHCTKALTNIDISCSMVRMHKALK